jgi:hypothetical protein
VQAHDKFKDRGVAFVSLTNMPCESAEAFVQSQHISWPSGYGVTRDALTELGAYGAERPLPGYDATPTLYVVGPDGRVRWHDRQQRLRHQGTAGLLRELDAEIERALAEPAAPAR